MQWTSRIVVQIYIPVDIIFLTAVLHLYQCHYFTEHIGLDIFGSGTDGISLHLVLLVVLLLEKTEGSVISNQIGMKFGRNVPWVNMHRLTESHFGCDVILLRWRPWRRFSISLKPATCEVIWSTVPVLQYLIHSTFVHVLSGVELSQVIKIAVSAKIRNTGFGN